MGFKVRCFVCGTEFLGAMYEDACPFCDWIYTGEEKETDPNETCEINKISINQAKSNFKKGLDIWGNPLKQSKDTK